MLHLRLTTGLNVVAYCIESISHYTSQCDREVWSFLLCKISPKPIWKKTIFAQFTWNLFVKRFCLLNFVQMVRGQHTPSSDKNSRTVISGIDSTEGLNFSFSMTNLAHGPLYFQDSHFNHKMFRTNFQLVQMRGRYFKRFFLLFVPFCIRTKNRENVAQYFQQPKIYMYNDEKQKL